MATKQEIENLIESTDIVSLVSDYVKLEKQGKNYIGLCPFHNEDTPSFIVSPEKKIAHCFGCKGGGNPINFLMQIENIEYGEAINRLAKRNGIKLSGAKEIKANPLKKYYDITNTAQEFYIKYLENDTDGKEAFDYLHKRGLTDDVIKAFKIGLSPKNGDNLYQVLKKLNFLELDMADVALVDKYDKGSYHDLFTRRIMFPIHNENGDVVAFSGRIFNNPDKSQPKYVNSRETVIFKKNESFFNFYQAKGEIRKRKRVIIHEGQMDVIAAFKAGFPEAICTMGTALGPEHCKILKKYTNHVVLCYDGDKAGVSSSVKAINTLQSFGFEIHLVLLPDGMDPDEFVLKNGPQAYHDYFENNMMDPVAYLFEQAFLNKNLKDANVVSAIKNEVFNLLASLNSASISEQYLDKLSQRLGVSYHAIEEDYKKLFGNKRIQPQQEENVSGYDYGYTPEATPVLPEVAKYEGRLFLYAQSLRERAGYIDSKLSDRIDGLSLKSQMLWIKLINEYYLNFDEFRYDVFMGMLTDEQKDDYTRLLDSVRDDQTPYTDEDLEKCLDKLLTDKYKRNNDMLSSLIERETDPNKQLKLISEKFNNKRRQNNLKKAGRK